MYHMSAQGVHERMINVHIIIIFISTIIITIIIIIIVNVYFTDLFYFPDSKTASKKATFPVQLNIDI